MKTSFRYYIVIEKIRVSGLFLNILRSNTIATFLVKARPFSVILI